MSIDQEKVIDFVGINKISGAVILTISDHLPWEDKVNEHIFRLQEKINYYLSAIEGGELLEKYPKAKGKKFVIKVIGKYPLPENELVQRFYEKATTTIQWAGFDLEFELAESSA